MENLSNYNSSENDIKTYRKIRKTIGYLGISLPIFLIIMSLIPFFKTSVQSSISSYYYTNLRDVFTGVLCAVGLFLIRYTGYKSSAFWKNDNLLTNIAGYMAFGVAFFPTNPDNWSEKIYTLIPLNVKLLGYFHYAFAALFFLIIAVISINVFTIGQKVNKQISVSFMNENNIYRTCGYLILGFIIMIPVFAYLKLFSSSTLIFEALALFAFGTSWLIKGRALGDKGKIGERIYMETN